MAGPIHSIRLKGPWDVLISELAPDVWHRHTLPCPWRECFGEIAGLACFRRNFHRPTGLEPGNRVCLRLPEGAGEIRSFTVNGVPIAPHRDDPLLFDCTSVLESFNRLELSLWFDPADHPDVPGGLWETVQIEIW